MYQYSYGQLQTALYESIDSFNSDKLKYFLSKGAVIKNSRTNHTLNYAIRRIFTHNANKFNLDFILDLIINGATTCNDEIDNTLSLTIKHYNQYLTKNIREVNKENMIKLVQLLIENGGKPSNSISEYNTLTLSIITQNLELVKMIEKLNPMPNVDTLNFAVKTKNLEIVKIACNLGAKPNNCSGSGNTFSHAILTGNPEIVEKIIIVGGKPNYRCTEHDYKYGYNINICYRHDTIPIFCNKFLTDNCDINNQILLRLANLLLCVGKIQITFKYIKNKIDRSIIDNWEEKMLDYEKLCKENSSSIKLLEKNKYDRVKKLANSLQHTMDELIEKSYDKKNRICELHNSIKIMPTCCINMIYEYQCTKPLIEYVDWTHKFEK